ncbi:MAG TPA: GNAT family N-acetyltransferase [Anaerolineales bacterium]|nr:GNAT family N-acetyltransferase [Anaerolineales bacterium]
MITIRRVLPEEAERLTQIALAAKRRWGYPERWIEIWTSELTYHPDYFVENESWAAELDHVPAAFYTLLEKGRTAWLENLWVIPELIGKGIGKELFLHAVDLARRRGYTLLQLEADPNAAGFYEKMGMHKIGERPSEVDGQPRVLPILEIVL